MLSDGYEQGGVQVAIGHAAAVDGVGCQMGLASASSKQKQIIQENLNILTDKLQQVQFV